jgi:NAD/NADP transhydrogenase beta subunit
VVVVVVVVVDIVVVVVVVRVVVVGRVVGGVWAETIEMATRPKIATLIRSICTMSE